MYRKRINDLLNEIGEVLDDYAHNKYLIEYYEKPKPHPNPDPAFKDVVQLIITLARRPEDYDWLIKYYTPGLNDEIYKCEQCKEPLVRSGEIYGRD